MNIGDIADIAGVSRAAVSRYLNNGYVSAEKRERIRRVIEETHYMPSVQAQTLRTKKTRLIGVVLPRINSDPISSVVEGIGAVLHEHGYNMLLASTDESPDKELDFLRIFSKNRVDGVILVATVFTDVHLEILSQMKIPVVIVGQRLEGYVSVYHSDYEAACALTRCVLESGRKRIGYISVIKEDVAVGQKRWQGFCDVMAEAGLPVPDEPVIADFSMKSGFEKMAELLSRQPDADAVICATDDIALGAMQYLKKQGKRIPEDVALASFGDNVLASVTTPDLTTVHYYYRTSGEEAAAKILALLEGTKLAEKELKLGFELKLRGST